MTYNTNLANQVREFLAEVAKIDVEEKEMFALLNFMVNGKTCVCVRGKNLMLRFDTTLQEELAEKDGYEPMMIKGKEYKGYCYVNPEGFKGKKAFELYIQLCLDYNKISKLSNKSVSKRKKTI